jgi:hypothetical protein
LPQWSDDQGEQEIAKVPPGPRRHVGPVPGQSNDPTTGHATPSRLERVWLRQCWWAMPECGSVLFRNLRRQVPKPRREHLCPRGGARFLRRHRVRSVPLQLWRRGRVLCHDDWRWRILRLHWLLRDLQERHRLPNER